MDYDVSRRRPHTITTRWIRHVAVCALLSASALSACSDGTSDPNPLALTAASEGTAEGKTIAGDPFALTAGECPKGYQLTSVKPGNITDANDNGWICVSKAGDVDDVAAPGAGTCPDDYELALAKPGSLTDVNGNGWICVNETDAIDDDLVAEDRMMVNGHGNFVSSGKTLDPQDISFSFHAIPQGTEFDGKGKFEFHDQLNGLNVHGSVECVATLGTQAFIAAVVTKSDDASLPVGITVGWFARDVGDPGGGVDGITRPSPLKKQVKGNTCSGAKFPAMATIVSGNIQVH